MNLRDFYSSAILGNMENTEQYSVKLDNFEGPLEFLLYLVQKKEIDIYDVRLGIIAEQFIEEMSRPDIDLGAEFVSTLASLILLKSKMLLPKHEQVANEDGEEEQIDPHFEVIHQLIDYCRFKQAGKEFVQREYEQNAYFPRGVSGNNEIRQPLGIEHLSLDDLALLFREAVAKAQSHSGHVQEESFRVSDKIRLLRRLLKESGKIVFETIFLRGKYKEELIVTFLAILELMKLGEACVVKDHSDGSVYILSSQKEGEL